MCNWFDDCLLVRVHIEHLVKRLRVKLGLNRAKIEPVLICQSGKKTSGNILNHLKSSTPLISFCKSYVFTFHKKAD